LYNIGEIKVSKILKCKPGNFFLHLHNFIELSDNNERFFARTQNNNDVADVKGEYQKNSVILRPHPKIWPQCRMTGSGIAIFALISAQFDRSSHSVNNLFLSMIPKD
jgi:hypothetical protein